MAWVGQASEIHHPGLQCSGVLDVSEVFLCFPPSSNRAWYIGITSERPNVQVGIVVCSLQSWDRCVQIFSGNRETPRDLLHTWAGQHSPWCPAQAAAATAVNSRQQTGFLIHSEEGEWNAKLALSSAVWDPMSHIQGSSHISETSLETASETHPKVRLLSHRQSNKPLEEWKPSMRGSCSVKLDIIKQIMFSRLEYEQKGPWPDWSYTVICNCGNFQSRHLFQPFSASDEKMNPRAYSLTMVTQTCDYCEASLTVLRFQEILYFQWKWFKH